MFPNELLKHARIAAFNLDKTSFDTIATELRSEIDLQIILQDGDPLLHRIGYLQKSRVSKQLDKLSDFFGDYLELGNALRSFGYGYKRLGTLLGVQQVQRVLGRRLFSNYSKQLPRWARKRIKPSVSHYLNAIPVTDNYDLSFESSSTYLRQSTRLRPHVINTYLYFVNLLLTDATRNADKNEFQNLIINSVDKLNEETVRLLRLQINELVFLYSLKKAWIEREAYFKKTIDRYGYKIGCEVYLPSIRGCYVPKPILDRFSWRERGYVIEHPDIADLLLWLPDLWFHFEEEQERVIFHPRIPIKPKVIAYPLRWRGNVNPEPFLEDFKGGYTFKIGNSLYLPADESPTGWVEKQITDKFELNDVKGYVVEYPYVSDMLLWISEDDIEYGKFVNKYHHLYKTPPQIIAWPLKWKSRDFHREKVYEEFELV